MTILLHLKVVLNRSENLISYEKNIVDIPA